MTRDDLLRGNQDLIATCIGVLKQQPFSRMSAVLDKATRSIHVTTSGLDCVDAIIDGHSGTSVDVAANATIAIPYPAATKRIELVGFAGGHDLQRRRIVVRS